MDQRGRKSAAKLAVVIKLPNARPRSPRELTPRQAEHWKRIAASMTSAWFTTATQPMLADLCRWIVRAEEAEAELQAVMLLELPIGERLGMRKTLLGMADQASRMVVSLERSMRLTQQSQRSADAGTTAAKRAPAEKKPWQ